MAKYTTELRSICESEAGEISSTGYKRTEEIIQKAAPKIFDFDFPIYDEAYRATLENNFLRHFYTREIGVETYARWKMFLHDKLNLIMPKFNGLYKSAALNFNPLYNVDYTETHSGSNSLSTSEHRSEHFENSMSQNSKNTAFSVNNRQGTNDHLTQTMGQSYSQNGEGNDTTTNRNSGKDENNLRQGWVEKSTTTDNVEQTNYGSSKTDTGTVTDKKSEETKHQAQSRRLGQTKTTTDAGKRETKDTETPGVTTTTTPKGTEKQTTKGTEIRLYSDTPQGQLNDVVAGKYLTNATVTKRGDDGVTVETSYGNERATVETKTGSNVTEHAESATTDSTSTTESISESTSDFTSNSMGNTRTDSLTHAHTGSDSTSASEKVTDSSTESTSESLSLFSSESEHTSGTSSASTSESTSLSTSESTSYSESASESNSQESEGFNSQVGTTNNINTKIEYTLDGYVRHVAGKTGGTDYADMILKYRETLVNIDMMIMDECEDLFMQLW